MSTSHRLVRRDTAAWKLQVWVAFGCSALVSAVGIWNLDSAFADKILLAMGFVFCLFTVLTLSKTIRDNSQKAVDTEAWRLTIWAAFGIAIVMTGWALFHVNIAMWPKGFMVVAWLFLQGSAFTLAKSLRDEQEADQLESVLAAQQRQ